MKKFISIASATAIALSTMTMPAFAATWYKVSNEELGLPTEEEARAITEAERGIDRAISDDMYAALFAAEESDIDTITDVELASEYFGDMNYNIERIYK